MSRRPFAAAGLVGPVFDPEERPQLGYVEPTAGPVDHRVEDAVHLAADLEQQVAVLLDLVDRVAVAEAAALLLVDVQTEAGAGGVDPPITDLAEAPYRLVARQGVCDLSQGLGIGDGGEAVGLLGEA
ncbi:MAG: hypothetical protein ACRDIC_20830 [bacterium]